jgi:hypothetical protein
MRGAGLIAIGVVAGFAISMLVFHSSNSRTPAAGSPESASPNDTQEATLAVSRSTAAQAEGASQPLDRAAAAYAAGRHSMEEIIRKKDELGADYGAAETKQKLLAAGFTPDRADWLIQRTKELKAAQLEIAKENAGKPAAEQREILRYLIDADLPLRDDVGDDEYARYREATGLPTGTTITGVVPDSNAASVGLKQGDEIVQYGGKHVYSYFDLLNMASESKSGEPTLLEVRRDGQAFQVLLPAGELGIQPESFASALGKAMSFSLNEKLKSQKLMIEEKRKAFSSAMEKGEAGAPH